MSQSPDPGRLPEQIHGGIDHRELREHGKTSERMLDLSANVLAVEHPESVRDAIFNAALAAYPDRECIELRERIAARHSIEDERVLVGNGCCELIDLVARSLLKPGKRVLVLEPTFAEYRRVSTLAGAEVKACFGDPRDRTFDWVSEFTTRLDRQRIDLAWICNPNNPTGESLSRDAIEDLARMYPDTVFAIDESYMDFAESTQSVANSRLENLICLRSLTKSHALAGLRLGYVVAADDVVKLLRTYRVPWSVNAMAQAAGIAVLDAQSHYDQAIEAMRVCRRRLYQELATRNLEPIESDTNFLLVPVENGAGFRGQLLQQDILVRDCQSFGLKDYVRLSVGDDRSIDRLLSALDGKPGAALDAGEHHLTPSPHRHWSPNFRQQLHELFRLRRDVRKFLPEPIAQGSVQRWLDAACMAPSVGLSQPWRFVSVDDVNRRSEIASEFETQNALAAEEYAEDRRSDYRKLKLAGIREAPEQLAVFVVPDPEQGRGLGRRTMPETVEYSVVAAIQNFWLAARADGVGVGWVSILRSERVNEILDVPSDWQLIAYLCIGYPVESRCETPSLETDGWEQRSKRDERWTTV